MANNTFEKNQKILYNSIPEQRLTYANQLTVKSWNDIVNILKTQANINADYLERLHKWLIGTGTGNVAIEGTKPFVEYILNDYVSLTENQEIEGDKVFSGHITAEDKATFNADTNFNGPTYINQIPEESTHATNKGYVDNALIKKADTSYVDEKIDELEPRINKNAHDVSYLQYDYVSKSADQEITGVKTFMKPTHFDDYVYGMYSPSSPAHLTPKHYVDDKIDQLVGEGAVGTLDTIGEISKALEENEEILDILNQSIVNKLDKAEKTGYLSAYVMYSDGSNHTMVISNGGGTDTANTIVRKGAGGVVYGQTAETSTGNSYVNLNYLKNKIKPHAFKQTYNNPVISESFADPNVWAGDDGWFYAVGTGFGKHLYKSIDLTTWKDCGYEPITANAKETIKSFGYNHLWALNVVKFGTMWHLYVSGVDTTNNKSAIILLKSPRCDGSFEYVDRIVYSDTDTNCIDPFVDVEMFTNKVHLYYGSHLGIYRIELNNNGTKIKDGAVAEHIAGLTINDDSTRENVFEGAYVFYHNNRKYLICSSGKYNGDNYKLRYGVASFDSTTNSWSDFAEISDSTVLLRNGNANNLLDGTNGDFINTGHCSNIFVDSEGQLWIFFHAKDTTSSTLKRPMFLYKLNITDNGGLFIGDGKNYSGNSFQWLSLADIPKPTFPKQNSLTYGVDSSASGSGGGSKMYRHYVELLLDVSNILVLEFLDTKSTPYTLEELAIREGIINGAMCNDDGVVLYPSFLWVNWDEWCKLNIYYKENEDEPFIEYYDPEDFVDETVIIDYIVTETE